MLLQSLLHLLSFSLVSAQFNFFDQMFGHHQQQQQQQRPSGASQWAAQSEQIQCSQYLCPSTLVCVQNPSECPCPDVQDVKCVIPDAEDQDAGTVLCVRGSEECAQVEKLMHAGK